MKGMSNPILDKLQDAKRDLEVLDERINTLLQQRAAAKARIEAFELSAKYIQDMQPAAKSGVKLSNSRQRMPSDDWKRIFGALCERYAHGFGYDDVLGVAAGLGISDLKKPSLRTKMMNLSNNGHAERVDDGRFRITDAGKKYFGLVAPETIEASLPERPEASKVTEGAATPSNESRSWQASFD